MEGTYTDIPMCGHEGCFARGTCILSLQEGMFFYCLEHKPTQETVEAEVKTWRNLSDNEVVI